MSDRTFGDALPVMEWDCDCTSDHRMCIERAWCYDCHEWCYSDSLCVRGELSVLHRLALRCISPTAEGSDRAYSQEVALHDLEAFLRGGGGAR